MPEKTESCPLGMVCSDEKCKGPVVFESRNPAALAVRNTVKMCARLEAIQNDSYVMGVREDVMRMHERVLKHTRTAPYIEEIHFRGNY